MASKRKTTDIVAFVESISPCKQKSVRIKLQVGENTTKKAICFDLKKLTKFHEKKKSCEPLKLTNVLIENASPSTPNFAEIIINSACEIIEPQPKDITFGRREPELLITDINNLKQTMENELVSVQGKVTIDPLKETRIVSSFGRNCKISDNNFISDHTATIHLTLWNEWIDEFADKFAAGTNKFKLFNVLLKYFDGKGLYVSTCSDTFTELYNTEDEITVELPGQSSLEVEVMTIDEIDTVGRFVYGYVCSKCSKTIAPSKNSIVRCAVCATSQKADRLEQTMKVEVGCSVLPTNPYVIAYGDLLMLWPVVRVDCVFSIDETQVTEQILNSKNLKIQVNHQTRTIMACQTCD